MTERPPAVAGTFYPADPERLSGEIENLLAQAGPLPPDAAPPKAIIAPHAGYIYSGPVAATAYARLLPARDTIRRVVLLGPAHFVFVPGLAAPSVDAFRTPLGSVPLDREALEGLLELPFVAEDDDAHAREHSLEVHLPFLQIVLAHFKIIPFVVGEALPAQLQAVLDRLWGSEETLVVVSSDLTHFHDYQTASQLDRRTADAIEALDPSPIGPREACGCLSIAALLQAAKAHHLQPRLLDLRNSGDTAGPRDRVVGYGAFGFQVN